MLFLPVTASFHRAFKIYEEFEGDTRERLINVITSIVYLVYVLGISQHKYSTYRKYLEIHKKLSAIQ